MKGIFKITFETARKTAGNQEGWAIMSSMIAVFVGLIMMAGIFGIVQIALSGSKAQTAQNNIATIRTTTRQLFSGQPDYTGLTTSLAISSGMLPSDMISGGNAVNTWGGSVTIAAGSPARLFDITYNDVPEEACLKLAPFGYGTWESASVNGSSISQSGGSAVSDAAAACSGSSNTIVFTSN